MFDSATTWAMNFGPSSSLAYIAHSLGYDCYFGNFRGLFPRKMIEGKDQSKYWDYSIDHLGKYDLAAFVDKIIEIKTKELKELVYS